VKAHGDMTHRLSKIGRYEAFHAALEPLRAARKLSGCWRSFRRHFIAPRTGAISLGVTGTNGGHAVVRGVPHSSGFMMSVRVDEREGWVRERG